MNFHFRFVIVFLAVLMGMSSIYGFTTNQGGAFTVFFDTQKAVVPNTDIQTQFNVTIVNNLEVSQEIEFTNEPVSGWSVEREEDYFMLGPNESKTISFALQANSNFDYSENVVSSDTIKIGKNDEYRGFFEFPIQFSSTQDDVSIVYQVEVLPEDDIEVSYIPRISTQEISPVTPLSFTVEARNISTMQNVVINSQLGEYEFEKIEAEFDSQDNYKVFTHNINESISPGNYNARIAVRQESPLEDSAQEWFLTQNIEVVPYTNIEIEKEDTHSLLVDTKQLTLTNQGNIEDEFEKQINHSFVKGLFFTSEENVEKTKEGVRLSVPLEQGEVKEIQYSYNYIGLYVLLLVVLFIIGYISYRKISNPMDVETKIYDVKRDTHEGIKSLKVRIGFENIKVQEIETLKVVFRMPAYLSVNEDSFLLSPPNNVYKGKTQYRLEWNFKRFEKNDSRILGFQLVNSKGVLGDIRFKDLEFEVKINGKIKKYYTTLPIVKG